MSNLLTYCQSQAEAMEILLRELVEYESCTTEKDAVNTFGAHVVELLRGLGAEVTTFPQDVVGDHILAKWNADAPGKPITYVGHIDTVWPTGTLQKMPIHVEDGRFYGPGAIDMKSGIVVMMTAIKALQDLGEFPNRPIWALLTSDEEKGSVYSYDLIVDVAKQSGLCLVIEPATPQGAIKTWRKGVADIILSVTGRASHAGGAPEEGINAVVELAKQIIKLNELNDLPNGTSVSVTMVSGGHTNNVIPEHAEAYADVRFLKASEAERIRAAAKDLYALTPGAALEVKMGDERPPLERDEKMLAAYGQLKAIGKSLGMTLLEGGSGGGSDGNYTASVGTPTLDGMGPTGAGLHAINEHVVLSSMPSKAALHAAVLRDWVLA